MFTIGDKVAYPMHGAGVIEGIEEQTILGEPRSYYTPAVSQRYEGDGTGRNLRKGRSSLYRRTGDAHRSNTDTAVGVHSDVG